MVRSFLCRSFVCGCRGISLYFRCTSQVKAYMIREYIDKIVRYFKSEEFRSRISRSKRGAYKFMKSKPFLYAAGVIIGSFVLINYVVMPFYVYHGGTLTVPDVTGLQFDEAQQKLYGMGLVGIQGEKILDNDHKAGEVLTQNPRPSSIVKYGRHIYLTTCGGELLVAVPALRGRSLRDARFALERNGLKLGTVENEVSDSYPANTIISQSATANDRLKKGMSVSVVVSTGRVVASTVPVPSLTGKSLKEAQKILEFVGLKVGNVTYQVNADLLPNTIIDQVPAAGTAVENGATVDLFVVKAGKLQDEN